MMQTSASRTNLLRTDCTGRDPPPCTRMRAPSEQHDIGCEHSDLAAVAMGNGAAACVMCAPASRPPSRTSAPARTRCARSARLQGILRTLRRPQPLRGADSAADATAGPLRCDARSASVYRPAPARRVSAHSQPRPTECGQPMSPIRFVSTGEGQSALQRRAPAAGLNLTGPVAGSAGCSRNGRIGECTARIDACASARAQRQWERGRVHWPALIDPPHGSPCAGLGGVAATWRWPRRPCDLAGFDASCI